MRWASATIESTTEAPPALVASPGRSQQNGDGRQLIAAMRAIARRASSGSTLTSCSRSGERIAELPERGHLMERHSASARTGSQRLPGASLVDQRRGSTASRPAVSAAPRAAGAEWRRGASRSTGPDAETRRVQRLRERPTADKLDRGSQLRAERCEDQGRNGDPTRPGRVLAEPGRGEECHASAFMR